MEKHERLQKAVQYLKYKHSINLDRDFADTLGVGKATLSSALNGHPRVLTDSFLYRFTERFPEIDTGWLLTGEGDMLRPAPVSQSGTGNTINQSGNNSASASITDGSSDISRALDEIGRLSSALTDSLSRKDGQISAMQEQISRSQEQTDRLLGIIETMNKRQQL